MTIDYAILGKKVMEKYPFMAKEMISIPDVDDLSMIPELFKEYCSIQADPHSKQEVTRHRLIFIAACVKLYDPDYFEGFKKNMRNGLRQQLSDSLSCKPTTISDSFKTVRNYLEIYPDFTNEVAYIYSKLKMYADGRRGSNPKKTKETHR